MALKAWREVAVPHRDIREGNFDESTFAADLADVRADRGPLEYRDPATFFRKTYPTKGMVRLLGAVLRRLAGLQGGEPVIQIQTPFGGGKTHSLVALYHLFRAGPEQEEADLVRRVLEEAGAEAIPDAQVAVFVGTAADPLKGKTPWGEIAEQLGHYELLKEHDEARRTPGKDLLHELLKAAGKPVLILMDEIAHYAAKCVDPRAVREAEGSLEEGRAYQTQVLTFFQELTEAVKVSPHAALVMTLPSSAPYGEEGERTLLQLQRIAGRMEAVYEPVKGWEIYDVLRTRLFERIEDEGEVQRVADAYFERYQRLGNEVPDEVREPAYRDRIRRAYPFHPELIDVLFERWGSLPTFQRTRGVLRLLAEIVSDLYRREHPAPLIHSAHVSLAHSSIRRELVKHIGSEFDSVIASDIADTNAKAQRLDAELGSEYARFHVASGLAAAIFLYSFSSGSRNGVGLPQLRVALLREDLPPALVGDALHRLEDTLWYLHGDSGLYRFSAQPNLNRIVVDRESVVDEAQIQQELRDRLEALAGNELRVFLEPSSPGDVPDTRELKLAVLAEPSEALVQELLERAGTTFRTHKNALFVLVPDPGGLADLHRLARRYLALRSIHDDRALFEQLSEENRRKLQDRLRDADGSLNRGLLMAYRRLFKLGPEGIESHDLGQPTVGERTTLAKRVYDYLEATDLLARQLAPRRVLRALSEGETEKPLDEIYEAFLNYPHLPILASRSVLEEAVCRGVEQGEFGVRVGDRTFFRQPIPAAALEGAVLVRKEAVPSEEGEGQGAIGVARREAGATDREVRAQDRATGTGAVVGETESADRVSSLDLTLKLPWNRLSDFLRGVLMPLRQEGAEIELEVRLRARSEGGISQATLEHKVRETLRQLGAEIEEEREGIDS